MFIWLTILFGGIVLILWYNQYVYRLPTPVPPHYLITRYGSRVNFAVVLMTDKYYTPVQVKQLYGLAVPIIVNNGLAQACGVYSTPQAVILNPDRRLYYRGNYNSSRYCSDEKSAYAKIALGTLLQKRQPILFSLYATRAYGCSLPGCKR